MEDDNLPFFKVYANDLDSMEELCRAKGAQMASIRSEAERDMAMEACSCGNSDDMCYVGLQWKGPDEVEDWMWLDGSPYDHGEMEWAWASGQPFATNT